MKKILTIAGSDCSGGAGIQADIKTITAHKMYAMSVITALTSQNTTGVFDVLDVDDVFVKSQMESCFSDIFPDSIKIGMVSNENIVKVIADELRKWGAKNIVIDPVMVATSGGKLIQNGAIKAIIGELFSIANVITPNLPEAEVLSGIKILNLDDMKMAAKKISSFTNGAVLVKGGHLENNTKDVLYDGVKFEIFDGKIVDTKNTHGTGCTLSSAIACGLAANLNLTSTIKNAKNFVFNALNSKIKIGHGNGAIDHCFRIPNAF